MCVRNPLFSAAILTPLLFFASGENVKSGRPCMFDPERPDVPNCIQTGNAGDLFVVDNYLRQLTFDRFGLAPVYTREDGWMYVNRRGRVVVSGVAAMDNWADSFHDGLVRVVKKGKYGFANQKGIIVIPRVYDGAFDFENGTAEVCRACHCNDRDSEHCALTGGEWYRIDTRGRVVARLEPQSSNTTVGPSVGV